MSTIHDSPDGSDCLVKTVSTSMFTAKLGGLWSLADMILRTKPTSVMGVTRGLILWTVPAAAIGATYASVSCLLGAIREKDSAINHVIGAATSMAVVGVRYGPKTACLAAVPISALAGVLKVVKMSGYDLIPDHSRQRRDFGGYNHYARHYGPRAEVKEPTNY